MVAPQVGLEPTTLRLTAECSAIELLRIILSSLSCSFPCPILSSRAFSIPASLFRSSSARFFYYGSEDDLSSSPLPLGSRQRLTLPGRFQPSTISAWRLNFCVRYGNRWYPPAIVTGNLPALPLAPLASLTSALSLPCTPLGSLSSAPAKLHRLS